MIIDTIGTFGMCFGRYDVVHTGHINQLKFCASLCDNLIVGVASDNYCNKRNLSCVRTLEDRMTVIDSIKYVFSVFSYDEHDPLILWNLRKTNLIFLNPEHKSDPIYLKVLPILETKVKIYWIPRTEGISSTEIKNKIKQI